MNLNERLEIQFCTAMRKVTVMEFNVEETKSKMAKGERHKYFGGLTLWHLGG